MPKNRSSKKSALSTPGLCCGSKFQDQFWRKEFVFGPKLRKRIIRNTFLHFHRGVNPRIYQREKEKPSSPSRNFIKPWKWLPAWPKFGRKLSPQTKTVTVPRCRPRKCSDRFQRLPGEAQRWWKHDLNLWIWHLQFLRTLARSVKNMELRCHNKLRWSESFENGGGCLKVGMHTVFEQSHCMKHDVT